MLNAVENIIIQPISDLYNFHTTVDVLRLDQLHPIISGNKWFKLKKYIETAHRTGKSTLLTYGGAYSNHLVATAAAARMHGFKSIGIVRGERAENVSHTLLEAESYGMQLFHTSRDEYRQKKIPHQVMQHFAEDELLIIGEGGYGIDGASGAAEIYNIIGPDYTHIFTAVGTGTTAAGIISAAKGQQRVTGISVMKNNHSLATAIKALLPREHEREFALLHDYHFGGYARHTPELLTFMNHLFENTGIPTDFVYTGKIFYAVDSLVRKNLYGANDRLLIVHSGGLQGNRSLPNGTLIFPT